MKNKKHCNTCEYSYTQEIRSFSHKKTRQLCDSADYNSRAYSPKLLLEDWDKGYCRFWMPKVEIKQEGIEL